MRRWILVLALVALAAGPLAASAGAASLDAHGWWWRPQADLLGTAIPPPGVPEDGLAVESLPDGPNAIAALRYVLDAGESGPLLVLTVADAQGDLAISACASTDRWAATHGGSWSERPTYDCGSAVEGTAAKDGKAWSWELTSLLEGRRLDVVLVPAPGAGRVTFEAPDDGSLQTQRETSAGGGFDPPPVSDFTDPDGSSSPGSSGDFAPPATTGGGFSGGTGSTFDPGDSGGTAPAPPQSAAPPTVAGDQPPAQLTPQVAGADQTQAGPTAAVPASSQSSTTIGAVVAAMAAVLGLALWHQDATARRQASALTRAGILGAGTQVGGLGRFARARTGAPQPLL